MIRPKSSSLVDSNRLVLLGAILFFPSLLFSTSHTDARITQSHNHHRQIRQLPSTIFFLGTKTSSSAYCQPSSSSSSNNLPIGHWSPLLFSFPSSLFSPLPSSPSSSPLLDRAHSHNDYLQSSPLFSALESGLGSAEADVFPIHGTEQQQQQQQQLWVAHTRWELDPTQTLERLYLQPLLEKYERERQERERRRENEDCRGGALGDPIMARHYKDCFPNQRSSSSNKPFTLLIDFKGDPDTTVELLRDALKPLQPYLSYIDTRTGHYVPNQLQIIISGNRPRPQSLHNSPQSRRQYLFLDGRIPDLYKPPSSSSSSSFHTPLLSMSWAQYWYQKVTGGWSRVVRMAAQRQQQIRIWGVPNRERVWKQMLFDDDHLILNIDDHPKYVEFAKREETQRERCRV